MSGQSPMTIEDVAKRVLDLVTAGSLREARDLYQQALVAVPRHPVLVDLLDKMPLHYDESFYATFRPRSLQSAKLILGLLTRHFVIRSVVDFGAGTGALSEAAHLAGAAVAVGIEGQWLEQSRLRFAGAEYRYQDLNSVIDLDRCFDLAISVEVAEHLHPSRGPTFIDDLCRASEQILFAAALPRQGGDGHINCRPHSYWVEEFRRNGYVCLDAVRPHVWYDPRVEPWHAQNCFLFAKSGSLLARTLPPAVLLDVYHPLMVNHHVQSDHENGKRDPVQ